jgi:hypothetical protein
MSNDFWWFDLLCMAVFPTIITALILIHNWRAHRPDCKHDWGRWDLPSTTLYAFVQTRTCTKCGFTEINQTKRYTKQP